MTRRLALTCGTMVAGARGSLPGFVLFSLSVAMLSLLAHTQLLPFDSELMDNMNSAALWQTLLALIVLLIRDASMFERTQYEVVGLVLLVTNMAMLSMLLIPVAPQLKAEVTKVVSSGKNALAKRRGTIMVRVNGGDGDGGGSRQKRLSTIPGVKVFQNPSYRERQRGREDAGAEGLAMATAVEVEMSQMDGGGGDIEARESLATRLNPMHAEADRNRKGIAQEGDSGIRDAF